MLFTMPKTTFFLRQNNDKQQTHSLYCRVTYKGTKTEFSTGEKIKHGEWDQMNQKFIGKKIKERYFETLTESISYNLKTIAIVHDFHTAKELITQLHATKKPLPSLSSIVENYIAEAQTKVKDGTLRSHQAKLSNLVLYEKKMNQTFNPVNFGLLEAENFKAWFMKKNNTQFIDTANRNILLFKSALQHACKKGLIENFSLYNYKGEKDKIKPAVFLSMEDLLLLQNQKFQNLMLNQIRDLFLFQCYTGLSYGDIWSSWKLKDLQSEKIMIGERKKNSQAFFIPVGNEAIEILEKYSYKLPRYCNEVYNRILKEIGALCGIKKRLTSHVGRKTFATLKDAEGWTRETVAKMLGHRSIRTTEIYYLGESTSRIENEMQKRIS